MSCLPARASRRELAPPSVQPRIYAAPKHGQIYWCDFWLDAMLPDMRKTRYLVVLRLTNILKFPTRRSCGTG